MTPFDYAQDDKVERIYGLPAMAGLRFTIVD